MIIDASVLLCGFFPDEAQPQAQVLLRDHAAGQERLKAPSLLTYEVTNAVWQAERRGRITTSQSNEILHASEGLEIEIIQCQWGECLPLARRFNRSAYDAAYLVVAEKLGEKMITADRRLFDAVHVDLEWVLWIGDYRG